VTGLADFRPGGHRAPGTPEPTERKVKLWEPMERDHLAHGNVLAFDPSLSSTGMVALAHDAQGLRVLASETLRGEASEELTGWELVHAQAADLHNKFVAAMVLRGHRWVVVHEAPPTGGGIAHSNPESTILAGTAVRYAAAHVGLRLLPMISPQAHKKATVGQANADKKTHHRNLRQYLPRLEIENIGMVTNEGQRDALSIALTALRRGL
jgi:Holliday junction resolvasome RuvABC endonuclease subunit